MPSIQKSYSNILKNNPLTMKKIFILLLTIFYLKSDGQNEIDALRYSQENILGSARLSSMAGSFGALGGDFSSLSFNPAGIGLYQSNEFSFSPIANINTTTSYFNNNNILNKQRNLNMNHFGLIYTSPIQDNNFGWKRINLGVGWNQIASYERKITISGENNTSSLADKMLEIAQNNTINQLNPLNTELAFWTDLIDLSNNTVDTTLQDPWYTHDNGNYISHISSNSNKRQIKRILSSGNKGEYVFSFGGSLNEKIYVGATIGMPSINYYEQAYYSEIVLEDTINNLSSFDFNEELTTQASGINIKIGTIIRISEQLKIGGNIHSPTLYNIQENYASSLTTYFENQNTTEYSPYNYFEYELLTPWKAAISASTIINKNILINADYELIDYSSIEMSSNSYDFILENEEIMNSFSKANNIKIGSEINLQAIVLRFGYAIYGSPYLEEQFTRTDFSYGIGIRNKNYFIDLAYVLSQNNENHKLYSEDYINPISLVNTNHNLIFTLGFRY